MLHVSGLPEDDDRIITGGDAKEYPDHQKVHIFAGIQRLFIS